MTGVAAPPLGVDVNTFVGGYPFRHVPHPEPAILARVLEREGVQGAWVGHLPSAFFRDPLPGNDELYAALEPYGSLAPVPVVRPDWPGWERTLADVVARQVRAIRAYPPQWGMGPDDHHLVALTAACGEAGVVLVLTTRFEDLRQRHWLDTAGDLTGAAIRAVARVSPRTHIVVTAAGKGLVEEVHWGLTPEEQSRVWWDISWIWGPPEDELELLIRRIGAERFVYGSGWPLRLAQTPRANLELLPDDVDRSGLASASDILSRAAECARG
jgi:predicted TIM-barrel fold metal-dependent hydrolase